MKTLLLATVLVLFSVAAAGAQDLPFAAFTKAVQEEKGGFAGDKGGLSKVFQAERVRLGPAFQSELWKYLADDADKHYWIGAFLTARSYLHGNDPLPELAFTIRLRALELLAPRNDPRSLGRQITINRHLAIASKLAGKQPDAERFRNRAEAIINQNGDLSAYVAGQTSHDRCIYQNISSDITGCGANEAPPETIVERGWLNSQARVLPQPVYPAELGKRRVKARVDVRIATDTDGNVISAEVIRGTSEFHKSAIEAAMQAKFPPMTLSGQPVKTSGWLSFEFKP